MRSLAFILALFSAAAFAALPPQYYEQARRDADTIIVIEVANVGDPPTTQGFGTCVVQGRVIGVLRGSQYANGAPVRINVPCRFRNAPIPAGGVVYQDFEILQRARYGRAYLAPGGELALYQYEILNQWTGPLPTP
ncbi:MAG: hypothetical protein AB7P07_00985 [Hyphomonadaceae bacterium]